MSDETDSQDVYLAYLRGVQAGQAALAADTLDGWVARMEDTLGRHGGDYRAAWLDTYQWAQDAAAEGRKQYAKFTRAAERGRT
jgi:hypothetical protein